AGVANGLVSVEQATLRLASAEAEVTGSFGLVAEQSGTLRYRVAVDSLSDFAALLPQSAPTPADSLSAEPSATDTLVSGSPEVAATDLSDAVVETVTIAAVERDAGADVDVTPDVVSTTIATAAGSTIA